MVDVAVVERKCPQKTVMDDGPHIAAAGFADTYAMLADSRCFASSEKLAEIRLSVSYRNSSGQLEILEMLLDRSKKEM